MTDTQTDTVDLDGLAYAAGLYLATLENEHHENPGELVQISEPENFIEVIRRLISEVLAQRDRADKAEAALRGLTKYCEDMIERESRVHACGDPGQECPMQDIYSPGDLNDLVKAARQAISGGYNGA